MNKTTKLKIALRYTFQGMAFTQPKYEVLVRAMSFIEDLTEGEFRKDGVTPVSHHMFDTTSIILTFVNSEWTVETNIRILLAALLHDAAEDFPAVELVSFGSTARDDSRELSKIRDGVKLTNEKYYGDFKDPILAIVKGADRISNLRSMNGVFSPEKIKSYCDETEQYVLPMLKRMRRDHARYVDIFESLKLTIESIISVHRFYLSTGEEE